MTTIGTVINIGVLGVKKAIGINDALEVTPRIKNAIYKKPRVLLASLGQIHGVNPQALETRIQRLKEMMAAPGDLAESVQHALENAFIPNMDPRWALVGLPHELWGAMEIGDPNIMMASGANPKHPRPGTSAQRKQSRRAVAHHKPGRPGGPKSKRIWFDTKESQSCLCSIWVLIALTTLSVALQEHESKKEIGSVRNAASSVLKSGDRT